MLGLLTVSLALLRAVDTTEADAFWVLIVQDFEGVAVEDANGFSTEVCSDKGVDYDKSNGQGRSNEEIVAPHRDCLTKKDLKVAVEYFTNYF